MCVFKRRLNVTRDSADLTGSGKAFHSTGAEFLKHLLPYVTVRDRGTHSMEEVSDRRDLAGTYCWRRSRMYDGDKSWRALYVWSSTLNTILCSTGSQCNLFSTGVMWHDLGVSVMRRAAVLWTRCSRLIKMSGRPYSRTLA